MSGSTGPRVYSWADRSSKGNHCPPIDTQNSGGMWIGLNVLPTEGHETEFNDGLQLGSYGMLLVPDTGDGTEGILMTNPQSDLGFRGCAIQLAQNGASGPKVGPLQPTSTVFLVVQRVTPSPYPNYESFVGLTTQEEGYAAPFTGVIQAVVPETSDASALTPIVSFGGVDPGYGGGPGYAITLGDGTNFGWGLQFIDTSDPAMGLGSTKISDTNPHLLVVRVTDNNKVTLITDGTPEVLAPNDSVGQGAPSGGFTADQIGHSSVVIGASRDAAYIKALMVYGTALSDADIAPKASYLKLRWHTV